MSRSWGKEGIIVLHSDADGAFSRSRCLHTTRPWQSTRSSNSRQGRAAAYSSLEINRAKMASHTSKAPVLQPTYVPPG